MKPAIFALAAALASVTALPAAEAASCNAQVDRPDLGYSFVPNFFGESRKIRIMTGLAFGNLYPNGLTVAPPAATNMPAVSVVMDYDYDPENDTLSESQISFQFIDDLKYADGSKANTSDLAARLVLPEVGIMADGGIYDLGDELALFQGDKYPTGANGKIINGAYFLLTVFKSSDPSLNLAVQAQFYSNPAAIDVAKQIVSERAKEAAAGVCSSSEF